MAGAPVVTRSIRLSVYNFFNDQYHSNEKTEQIIKTLTKLSGLNVERGGLLGKKFHAYFDDVDSANAAALIVVHIIYCKTRVHKGTFNVTNLVIGNSMGTSQNLNQ